MARLHRGNSTVTSSQAVDLTVGDDLTLSKAGGVLTLGRASDASGIHRIYSDSGNNLKIGSDLSSGCSISFVPSSGSGTAMSIADDGDISLKGCNTSASAEFTISAGADNQPHLGFSQGGRTNVIDNFYSAGSTDSTIRLRVSNGNVDGTSNWALRCYADGRVHSEGAFSASQSDKRLKTDITNITTPLSKISAINGVDFKWISNLDDIKTNSGLAGKTDVGVIAQEIEAVLPHAVNLAPFDHANPNKDGSIPEDAVTYKGEISQSGENYLTVDYTKIIPLLIEGIKELSAKVTALENA